MPGLGEVQMHFDLRAEVQWLFTICIRARVSRGVSPEEAKKELFKEVRGNFKSFLNARKKTNLSLTGLAHKRTP